MDTVKEINKRVKISLVKGHKLEDEISLLANITKILCKVDPSIPQNSTIDIDITFYKSDAGQFGATRKE